MLDKRYGQVASPFAIYSYGARIDPFPLRASYRHTPSSRNGTGVPEALVR